MLGKQRSKEFPWQTPRVTTNPGNDSAITDTLLFYLVFILEGGCSEASPPLFLSQQNSREWPTGTFSEVMKTKAWGWAVPL